MSRIGNSDREGDKAFRIAKQQIPTATFVYKRMKDPYKNEKHRFTVPIQIEEITEDNTDFHLNALYVKTSHTELVIAQTYNN
jgi:hypothetical protein